MYSSRNTPGFICVYIIGILELRGKNGTYQVRTRTAGTISVDYSSTWSQPVCGETTNSITIHRCEPLRNDPWYLWWGSFYINCQFDFKTSQYWRTKNELRNVRWVQLGQNLYFLLNIFYFVFSAFKIYDLYSNSLLCTFVVAVMRLKNERPYTPCPHPLYTSPKDPLPRAEKTPSDV
jgi:hypothetical protein